MCRECGTVGHGMDNCNASENHGYHCESEHIAGSRECDKQKTEEVLLNIQEKHKVHIMRAKQILQNNNEHSDTRRTQFVSHFDCEMTEQNK